MEGLPLNLSDYEHFCLGEMKRESVNSEKPCFGDLLFQILVGARMKRLPNLMGPLSINRKACVCVCGQTSVAATRPHR